MQAIIKPSFISGKIKIPSSKSDIHRALICATLAKNQDSIIYNVDLNDDVKCTIKALKNLGAKIAYKNHIVTVHGFDYQHKDKLFFDAKESGSTLRFLIPLLSFFASELEIKGTKTLLSRPLSVYQNILKDNMIIKNNKILITKDFNQDYYQVDGSISSQFISGLLFFLPLIDHDSTIEIQKDFVSRPYVLMTINTLRQFGIDIILNDNIIHIKGNQEYKAVKYSIEGDYSSASYISTLGLFNDYVDCYYLDEDSLQADKEYLNIIEKMNGNIILSNKHLISKKSTLNNIDVDIDNCPDLGPLLIVLMLLNNANAHLLNTRRLALKESSRGLALKEELNKFSIDIDVHENDIYILGNQTIKTPSKVINSHNDHRILMALVIFALCSKIEITIDNIECVNKSYPKFFKDLIKLGAEIIFQ